MSSKDINCSYCNFSSYDKELFINIDNYYICFNCYYIEFKKHITNLINDNKIKSVEIKK
jgi:hypothetical protein